MNVEHLLVARRVVLEATGGADVVTVAVESGTPYRHYMAWVKVYAATINVSVQPLFGGQNDGAAVVINTAPPNKVIQVPIEEIRPPTNNIQKHPDDMSPPIVLKSELQITNSAAVPATVDIWMIAAATPGGA
jgi:hypothetical protein